MSKDLPIVHFQIHGADFLCIPCRLTDDKLPYKLCWIKKISDINHVLSFEYELLFYVESVTHAKKRAEFFLKYYK